MEHSRIAPETSSKGKRNRAGNTLATQEALLLSTVMPAITPNENLLLDNLLDETHHALSLTPESQGLLLEIAEELISAVDQQAVMAVLLKFCIKRLGFSQVQYLEINREKGEAEILYEQSKSGTEKPHSKPVLTLPLLWGGTGQVRGSVHIYYQQASKKILDNNTIQLVRKAIQLVSQALSRTYFLEKALTMASIDELTGLMNRRGYYERFESELERARRHQTHLAVALVDVDHFKNFNDLHGHLSGDLILKVLSDVLTQNLRKSDLVCRFGGEEFAILLPDTGLKSAAELMERVRESVTQIRPRGLDGSILQISISIGLAEVNIQPNTIPHRSEISDSLARADKQLYRAKDGGRNQVCF